jgi:hypothetical protein
VAAVRAGVAATATYVRLARHGIRPRLVFGYRREQSSLVSIDCCIGGGLSCTSFETLRLR